MKVQPTTRQLLEMLYERLPFIIDKVKDSKWQGLTDTDLDKLLPFRPVTLDTNAIIEYTRLVESVLRTKNDKG